MAFSSIKSFLKQCKKEGYRGFNQHQLPGRMEIRIMAILFPRRKKPFIPDFEANFKDYPEFTKLQCEGNCVKENLEATIMENEKLFKVFFHRHGFLIFSKNTFNKEKLDSHVCEEIENFCEQIMKDLISENLDESRSSKIESQHHQSYIPDLERFYVSSMKDLNLPLAIRESVMDSNSLSSGYESDENSFCEMNDNQDLENLDESTSSTIESQHHQRPDWEKIENDFPEMLRCLNCENLDESTSGKIESQHHRSYIPDWKEIEKVYVSLVMDPKLQRERETNPCDLESLPSTSCAKNFCGTHQPANLLPSSVEQLHIIEDDFEDFNFLELRKGDILYTPEEFQAKVDNLISEKLNEYPSLEASTSFQNTASPPLPELPPNVLDYNYSIASTEVTDFCHVGFEILEKMESSDTEDEPMDWSPENTPTQGQCKLSNLDSYQNINPKHMNIHQALNSSDQSAKPYVEKVANVYPDVSEIFQQMESDLSNTGLFEELDRGYLSNSTGSPVFSSVLHPSSSFASKKAQVPQSSGETGCQNLSQW